MAQMNRYQRAKERARNEAIDWQEWESNNPVSWGGVAIAQEYLTKLAKRFGLVREFKENGII